MIAMPRMENQIKSEQRLVLVFKTGKWISKATMYSIEAIASGQCTVLEKGHEINTVVTIYAGKNKSI